MDNLYLLVAEEESELTNTQNSSNLCSSYNGPGMVEGQAVWLPCIKTSRARYVKLTTFVEDGFLQVAEVEIYGLQQA